jgi:four helix bundle protein
MMLELEKKAYIFSVESIGFSKDLEKQGIQPELAGNLRQAAGRVYTLLTDALEAEENKDFASLFRQSRQQASEARGHLDKAQPGEDALMEKKKELNTLIDEILKLMDEIEGKLIY